MLIIFLQLSAELQSSNKYGRLLKACTITGVPQASTIQPMSDHREQLRCNGLILDKMLKALGRTKPEFYLHNFQA